MKNLNFDYNYKIPNLSLDVKKNFFNEAINSKRRRNHLIIHNRGDEFNQVFSFICSDSYMRPHLHPSSCMIEKMHLVEGSFELFFFDNKGSITKTYLLDKPGQRVQVPALQWHTYVMRSNVAIIFETLMGKYDPLTWKKMADWAPEEGTIDANIYFKSLKDFKT
jgi:cupin fold WbuC family metalloprotein